MTNHDRRVGRLARRLAGGLALACVAAVSAGAGCVAALPEVDGAPMRAARIEAAHREPPGAPVPERLARAAIAGEDEQFEAPVTANVLAGVARAAGAFIDGQVDPGGATIDQQLAKALYDPRQSPVDTVRQIGLGIKLGLEYSHRQILAMYLNVNYYGHGFWGVAQAAEGYFGVGPSQLSWDEAAMLAGLLQAPSADDPLLHLAAARRRQAYVLRQLVADGVLSPGRARRALARPLPLHAGQRPGRW